MNDEGLMRMIAYGILGSAIAIADAFGVDAEVFVADLTRHTGGERQRVEACGVRFENAERGAS